MAAHSMKMKNDLEVKKKRNEKEKAFLDRLACYDDLVLEIVTWEASTHFYQLVAKKPNLYTSTDVLF